LTLLLTTPSGRIIQSRSHYKHGDGVKALALTVEDATSLGRDTKRGGKSYMEPKTLSISMARS
jgi:4-hydroxyphenylpyruvate dioxygenase